ncbi:hypothetical protein [Streptomyces sp. NPDC058092]|uniref:hypothetical protein n=1 Tax=Streptomyces sp. NPDC058092 TaxID=3346336 RepID=UPI0036F0359A
MPPSGVFLSDRRKSGTAGNHASAWALVAVLAVLALIFGPKIVDAAKKDDVPNAGSLPTSIG